MPRLRSVGSSFFLDHKLDLLSEAHQKLFLGVKTLADKEGRLHDDPKRIKAQIFPYRSYDVDEMLDVLHNAGFVVRYEAGGHCCISIPSWTTDQRPHPKEPALGLPHPPKDVQKRDKQFSAVAEHGGKLPADGPSGRDPALVVSGSGSGNGSFGGSREQPPPPPLPKKPENRFESGPAFFSWLQHERHEAGYVTERPPDLRALGAWFSEFIGELGGDTDWMMATLRAFLKSEHWKPKGFPFHAFMKRWRDFVPRKQRGIA